MIHFPKRVSEECPRVGDGPKRDPVRTICRRDPLFVGGVAQAFHDDQVVELRVQLAVQEAEGKEEDREGLVEVEEEKRSKETQRSAFTDDHGNVHDKTPTQSQ